MNTPNKDNQVIAREAVENRNIELEALPCPFCGSDEIQLNSIADGSWTLDCHTCGAGSGTNDKEFVLTAWNKRTPLTEILKKRGLDADDVEAKIRSRIAATQPQRSKDFDPNVTEAPWLKPTSEQPSYAKASEDRQEWRETHGLIYQGDTYVGRALSSGEATKICVAINASLTSERQRREQETESLRQTIKGQVASIQKRLGVCESHWTVIGMSEPRTSCPFCELLSALAAIEKMYDRTRQLFHNNPHLNLLSLRGEVVDCCKAVMDIRSTIKDIDDAL